MVTYGLIYNQKITISGKLLIKRQFRGKADKLSESVETTRYLSLWDKDIVRSATIYKIAETDRNNCPLCLLIES
jgi:hypothetical protein